MYPVVALTTERYKVVEVKAAFRETRPRLDVVRVQAIVGSMFRFTSLAFVPVAPINRLDKFLPE